MNVPRSCDCERRALDKSERRGRLDGGERKRVEVVVIYIRDVWWVFVEVRWWWFVIIH